MLFFRSQRSSERTDVSMRRDFGALSFLFLNKLTSGSLSRVSRCRESQSPRDAVSKRCHSDSSEVEGSQGSSIPRTDSPLKSPPLPERDFETPSTPQKDTWTTFIEGIELLTSTVGRESIDLVRARIPSLDQLEAQLGVRETENLVKKVVRLVSQALPPHFPVLLTVQADILFAVDNMISQVYEKRITALTEQCFQSALRDLSPSNPLTTSYDENQSGSLIQFYRISLRERRFRNSSIEEALSHTTPVTHAASTISLTDEVTYEYRRA